MLARKYDNAAWEEEQVTTESLEVVRQRQKAQAKQLNRRRMAMLVGVVLLTYFVSVVRSEAYVRAGHTLVSMRQQETQLINRNSELKIEVEELKGPDRIIGLAQQRLGMQVARSNIYVKGALPQKN